MSARKKKHRHETDERADLSEENVLFEPVGSAGRDALCYNENSSFNRLLGLLQNNLLPSADRLERRTDTDNQAEPQEKKVKDTPDMEVDGTEDDVSGTKTKNNKSSLDKKEFEFIETEMEAEQTKEEKTMEGKEMKRAPDNVKTSSLSFLKRVLKVLIMDMLVSRKVLNLKVIETEEKGQKEEGKIKRISVTVNRKIPGWKELLIIGHFLAALNVSRLDKIQSYEHLRLRAAPYIFFLFIWTVVYLRNRWNKRLLTTGKHDFWLHQHPTDSVEIKATDIIITKEKPIKSSNKSLRVSMGKRDELSCNECGREQGFEVIDISDEKPVETEIEDQGDEETQDDLRARENVSSENWITSFLDILLALLVLIAVFLCKLFPVWLVAEITFMLVAAFWAVLNFFGAFSLNDDTEEYVVVNQEDEETQDDLSDEGDEDEKEEEYCSSEEKENDWEKEGDERRSKKKPEEKKERKEEEGKKKRATAYVNSKTRFTSFMEVVLVLVVLNAVFAFLYTLFPNCPVEENFWMVMGTFFAVLTVHGAGPLNDEGEEYVVVNQEDEGTQDDLSDEGDEDGHRMHTDNQAESQEKKVKDTPLEADMEADGIGDDVSDRKTKNNKSALDNEEFEVIETEMEEKQTKEEKRMEGKEMKRAPNNVKTSGLSFLKGVLRVLFLEVLVSPGLKMFLELFPECPVGESYRRLMAAVCTLVIYFLIRHCEKKAEEYDVEGQEAKETQDKLSDEVDEGEKEEGYCRSEEKEYDWEENEEDERRSKRAHSWLRGEITKVTILQL